MTAMKLVGVTQMNKMIERVSKALELERDEIMKDDDYVNCGERLAKAAINAMREPTEEMIKAGELIGLEYGYISNHDYKSIWQRRKTLERMLEVLGEIESDLEKRQIKARQPKKTSETFKP